MGPEKNPRTKEKGPYLDYKRFIPPFQMPQKKVHSSIPDAPFQTVDASVLTGCWVFIFLNWVNGPLPTNKSILIFSTCILPGYRKCLLHPSLDWKALGRGSVLCSSPRGGLLESEL